MDNFVDYRPNIEKDLEEIKKLIAEIQVEHFEDENGFI